MSKKFFEKQKAGIGIVFAEWRPDEGMPDDPDHWTTLFVRLEDGSTYSIKKTKLQEQNHKPIWKE